jgi:hypothetical protein
VHSQDASGPTEPGQQDDPQDRPEGERAPTEGPDIAATWEAVRALLEAVYEFVTGLFALTRSELRLARVSWPLVFALLVSLVGLSLSLWASLIALTGWGLYMLTASVGLALAALVLLHLVLLVGVRMLLRRTSRHMTLPATRAEIRGWFRHHQPPEDS